MMKRRNILIAAGALVALAFPASPRAEATDIGNCATVNVGYVKVNSVYQCALGANGYRCATVNGTTFWVGSAWRCATGVYGGGAECVSGPSPVVVNNAIYCALG